MSRYVKHFKVKDGYKDENNKFMPLHIDEENLLERYKTIQTKIENLKNIESNILSIYDDRYIKTKLRVYCDKFYTNLCGLNVPEDNVDCEPFTVISIDSLPAYENKYYLQVYLENYDCKISNT